MNGFISSPACAISYAGRACSPLIMTLSIAAAFAQSNDVPALRSDIQKMQEGYEARLKKLESYHHTPLSDQSTQPKSTNPNISLILSGQYGRLSKNTEDVAISGFKDSTSERPIRGFGLSESELGISGSIDHLFFGNLTLAISDEEKIVAEEAYIKTTALPAGFTIKTGRFFSGLGYQNEQHAHVWNFVDAPLAYQALLGGKFSHDGLQIRWVAPSTTWFELGAELGNGGAENIRHTAQAKAIFAHVGGDIDTNNNWRAGLSYVRTDPKDKQWHETDINEIAVTNQWSGQSKVWIVDGVWKWSPNGNTQKENFKLQSEYVQRQESGVLTYDVEEVSAGKTVSHYSSKQSGWYVQGVYQWNGHWSIGLRSESLKTNRMDYGANSANLGQPDHKPTKQSLSLDFQPSHFSRIRLQVAQDKSQDGRTDNQMMLQYQMSLGAHGAHSY